MLLVIFWRACAQEASLFYSHLLFQLLLKVIVDMRQCHCFNWNGWQIFLSWNFWTPFWIGKRLWDFCEPPYLSRSNLLLPSWRKWTHLSLIFLDFIWHSHFPCRSLGLVVGLSLACEGSDIFLGFDSILILPFYEIEYFKQDLVIGFWSEPVFKVQRPMFYKNRA